MANPLANQAADHSSPSAGPARAPLAPVLTLTVLASLGTGAVTNGLFFVTHEALGFSEARNLVLALVMGASYTVGAWRAAPMVRSLAARSRWLTAKRVLLLVNVCLAGVSVLPSLAGGSEWAFWTMAAVYLPLTGVLWPIVEAYVSGGREGRSLRRATGAFNFAWSLAVLAAFWAMAPLLRDDPLRVVAGMAGVHGLCALVGLALPHEPARHIDHARAPHPQVYARLLPVFRVLLTLSYVLVNALEPILPARLAATGVSASASARLASVWAGARVLTFLLCALWHGWHGRWRTVFWTAGVMLLGFALAASATSVSVAVIGLALFGVGVGGVYVAAIYYAMAVGRAGVDAGGAHETVIGLGYTAGPLPALAAHALVAGGVIPREGLNPALLTIVALGAAAMILWAWRLSRRAG